MAVVIETTLGDLTVDLFLDQRPQTCLNFLKLCKLKYYNFNLFHTIQNNFIAQVGDPTGEGSGGQSVWGVIDGPEKRFFSGEKMPKIRHSDIGLLSMVCTGDHMVGSQFFFTLGSNLDSLDGVHCVIGIVTEGHEVLRKLNEVICDETHRPYQDVRITHTVILEDPFDDPKGMGVPSRSPSPSAERLAGGRLAPDEEIDEAKGKSAAELNEAIAVKEAKARATILEIVGDLPDADVAPPENVLFVCKLNPVTTDDDLELIFSRFGEIKSCEVIRDKKTGNSLQYAFIEFAEQKSCEDAYFKMDNVLIDDRRIHVDFSQSVSKIKWLGKGRGVQHFNDTSDNKVNDNSRNFKKSKSRERIDKKYERDIKDYSHDSRKNKSNHKIDSKNEKRTEKEEDNKKDYKSDKYKVEKKDREHRHKHHFDERNDDNEKNTTNCDKEYKRDHKPRETKTDNYRDKRVDTNTRDKNSSERESTNQMKSTKKYEHRQDNDYKREHKRQNKYEKKRDHSDTEHDRYSKKQGIEDTKKEKTHHKSVEKKDDYPDCCVVSEKPSYKRKSHERNDSEICHKKSRIDVETKNVQVKYSQHSRNTDSRSRRKSVELSEKPTAKSSYKHNDKMRSFGNKHSQERTDRQTYKDKSNSSSRKKREQYSIERNGETCRDQLSRGHSRSDHHKGRRSSSSRQGDKRSEKSIKNIDDKYRLKGKRLQTPRTPSPDLEKRLKSLKNQKSLSKNVKGKPVKKTRKRKSSTSSSSDTTSSSSSSSDGKKKKSLSKKNRKRECSSSSSSSSSSESCSSTSSSDSDSSSSSSSSSDSSPRRKKKNKKNSTSKKSKKK